VTLALLAVTLVGGCGGGDERLSKEEYAQRADAVCRRVNVQTRALGRPQTLSALARAADRSVPYLDGAIRDLRKLRPSREEEASVRTWLRQLTMLRADVVRLRDRARANDARGVTAVAGSATPRNERFAQLAAQLGMRVCSRP
jgi:hypothetical protein